MLIDHKNRCAWCLKDSLYMRYHDEEWGVPMHNDRQLFEMLVLEGAQAGLSWHTILKKRENYRKAFDNFDAQRIVSYDETKLRVLLLNEGIVRNKLKIHAAITNARAFLGIQEAFGSFDHYIWQFTNYKTIVNHYGEIGEVAVKTKESDAMSEDLLSRGFKFVGATICYAYMQATGMVDDHVTNCWRK